MPLGISGVYGIASLPFIDDRGSFSRIWEDFDEVELASDFKHISISKNISIGTTRGLHYQEAPNDETKVVTCIAGLIFDVIVDLRESSGSFGKYLAVNLGPESDFQGLYIPNGFAHGFQTLESNSTLLYMMNKPYSPESACGIRWDDSYLGISWPLEPRVISEKDRNWPKSNRK